MTATLTPAQINAHVDRWIAEAGHMPPNTAARLLRERAYWIAAQVGRYLHDTGALTAAEGRLWAAAGDAKGRAA